MTHRPRLALFLALVATFPLAAQTPGPAAPAGEKAAPAPAYKREAGPFEVVTIARYDLKDPKRPLPTPLRIRAPRPTADHSGPFPLVIFSHGAGGSSDAFAELSRHWCSHGYVVVHPTHSDSIRLRRERGEKMEDLQTELKNIVRRVNPLDRRADVELILDSLDELEREIAREMGAKEGDPPTVRIDRERIALAGHSAGAFTTQMLAGVKFASANLLGGKGAWGDARIKCFIVISGQGLTRPAFTKDSWSGIKSPMLVIAGSKDVSPVSDETPESRRHPYEYAPPGDKYLIFIDGATHSSYAGKQTSRLLREATPKNIDYITDVVAFGTLSFLDAHLARDAAAREYLASDALTRYPGGKTEFLRK